MQCQSVTLEYDFLRKIEPYASLLGPKNSSEIVECVEKTLKGKRVEYLGENRPKGLYLKQRFNPYINIVEIAEGCLGNCSYCIVKKAKGTLVSRPISDIKRDINMSLKEGCKEIWLTSQDCGCYGMDRGKRLTDLLKEVTNIPGNFRVRLGMSNPNFVKRFLSDLIDIYRDKKMYKFLHIPLQSGSDKVLRDMKRQYVAKDFIEIVKKFRENIPEVTIWTDIIVGFPTETESDFRKTLKIVRETKPDYINVSKFGIRPGTEASKMKQLNSETTKKRSKILGELVDKICLERNKNWMGKECQVLVTEKRKNQYIGRNESYKQIIIETERDIRGNFVTAEIRDVRKTHLIGKLKMNEHCH